MQSQKKDIQCVLTYLTGIKKNYVRQYHKES